MFASGQFSEPTLIRVRQGQELTLKADKWLQVLGALLMDL